MLNEFVEGISGSSGVESDWARAIGPVNSEKPIEKVSLTFQLFPHLS